MQYLITRMHLDTCCAVRPGGTQV